MTKDSTLTSVQLKQMLIDVKEHGNNTCVRLRLIGEMWQENFVRVVSVGEDRVLFNDELKNKLVSIPLANVMQVEIDHKFKQFEPHNHYTVVLDNFR